MGIRLNHECPLLPKLQQNRISNPNISNATTYLSNNSNASQSKFISGFTISSTLLRNNDKVQNWTINKDSSYLFVYTNLQIF